MQELLQRISATTPTLHSFTANAPDTFCFIAFVIPGPKIPTYTNAHEKKISIKCDICSMEFSLKPQFRRHMVLVHEEKSFKCTICSTSFGWENNLRNHISIVHEKIKPFKCEVCDHSFRHKSRLKNHKASVHEKRSL